jgi:hypothetical protein
MADSDLAPVFLAAVEAVEESVYTPSSPPLN